MAKGVNLTTDESRAAVKAFAKRKQGRFGPVAALLDKLMESRIVGGRPWLPLAAHTVTHPEARISSGPVAGRTGKYQIGYELVPGPEAPNHTALMHFPERVPDRRPHHHVVINTPTRQFRITAPVESRREFDEAHQVHLQDGTLQGYYAPHSYDTAHLPDEPPTKLSRDRRVPLSDEQAALVKAHGKKKRPTAPLLALADWMMEKHSDAPAGKWFAHVLTHPKAKVIYRGASEFGARHANVSVQPIVQHPEHPDVRHGVGVGVWHRLDIEHPRHSLTVYAPVESRPELHEAVNDFVHPARLADAHAMADSWADEHGLPDEVPTKLARRTVPVGDADTLPLLEAHPTKGVKAGRVTTPLLALADLLHERHGHEPVGKWITHTLTKPGARVRRQTLRPPYATGTVEYAIYEHRPDDRRYAPWIPADTPRGVYHVVHIDHPMHRLTVYAPVTHANEIHEAAADLAGDSPAVAKKAAEFAERHGLSPERLARVQAAAGGAVVNNQYQGGGKFLAAPLQRIRTIAALLRRRRVKGGR